MPEVAFVLGELRREWIIMRHYWFNFLAFVVTLCLLFGGLILAGTAFAGQGAVQGATLAGILVGLLLWTYSQGMLELFTWNLANEATSGTLEHLYLSPIGPVTIFLVRGLAKLVSQTIIVVVLLVILELVSGIRLHLPLTLVPVVLLAVADVAGMTLMLGGLMLVFKRIENFSNIVQMLLLFFTGALTPLKTLSPVLVTVSHLLPLTYGVDIARRLCVDGARLADLGGPLLGLLVNTAAWLTAGLITFTLCDRAARRRGTLGQY